MNYRLLTVLFIFLGLAGVIYSACPDAICDYGEECSLDCSSETYCDDGMDNDEDGNTDCDDDDCSSDPVCRPSLADMDEDGYYDITSCAELQSISLYLNNNYELENDVDCTGVDFIPIIGPSEEPFTGIFEGNGFSIINLSIDGAPGGSYYALFGYTQNAIIANVALVNVLINAPDSYEVGSLVGYSETTNMSNSHSTGNVYGGYPTGGLVGDAYEMIISNCYFSGLVNSTNTYAGGLVGFIQAGGELSGSYSTGTVNSSGDNVGGLVGSAAGTITTSYSTTNVIGNDFVGGLVGEFIDATLSNSYATGTVFGAIGTDSIGGLVGYSSGSVVNSYSTGNVSGSTYVGGLVGQNEGGSVTNSFSTGNVTSSGLLGGLVGVNINSGTISNSFWYNRSQGLDCYSSGNANCTSIEDDPSYFFDSSNEPLTNWDFETIWQEQGSDYPVLRWQDSPPTPSGGCINLSDPSTWGTSIVDDGGQLVVNDDATLCTDTYSFAETALLINSSDITLDCNGSILTGSSIEVGISNDGSTNVTIANCNVLSFNYGFYSVDSGTTFINNTATSNDYGFYTDSSNLIFINNTASGNNHDGFHSRYSDSAYLNNSAYGNVFSGLSALNSNVTFTNNTAHHNEYGIGSSFSNSNFTGNVVYNAHEGIISSSSISIITNNTVYDCIDYGFGISDSPDSSFTDNIAHNTRVGFTVVWSTVDFTNNTAYDNTGNGFESHHSTSLLINNTAHNNSLGFWSVSSSSIFTNNTAYSNAVRGFDILSSESTLVDNIAYDHDNNGFGAFISNATFINNLAYDTRSSGFFSENSNTNFTNNTARNNPFGIFLSGSISTLINNTARDNTESGFASFDSTSIFTNNNATNNSVHGFYSNSNSNYTNNIANDNGNTGFYLASSNSTMLNNTAYGNSDGFSAVSSPNATLTNNTAYQNSRGFVSFASVSTFTNNTAYDNWYGLYSEYSRLFSTGNDFYDNSVMGVYSNLSLNSTFTNDTAYGNQIGFYSSLSNSTFTGVVAYANDEGVRLEDLSDMSNLSGTWLYNNSKALYIYSSGSSWPFSILNSKLGYFSVNVSVIDEVTIEYYLNDTSAPGPDPLGYVSLDGKYLLSTAQETIDNMTFYWSDGEADGHDESSFRVFAWNGTAWEAVVGQSSDPATNSLTLLGFTSIRTPDILGLFADIDSLSLIIHSPENTTYTTTDVPLNYTVSEQQSCWYTLNGGEVQPLQVCDNISLYLDDGYYELLLYANDSYGNLNSTGVNFTVDTHAPVTVLNSPADGSYLSVTDITLNQTTTDNIFLTTDCIMQLTGYAPYLFTAINNTPFLTPISSIPENTYYWNVTCTDDAGNSAIDSNGTWSFTIDRTEPYLEIISPTSTSYNTSTVNLNFTVSDTNLDSCWYVLDDNAPVYSCNNDTLDSLSEGEHNVTVYANDSAGNTNSTDTVYFTVDTIPPSVSLFNPINGFNTTYTSPGVVSVFFNFTATDATSGIDNCTWYFDGSAGNNYTEPFYFAWAVVSPSAFETMHNWSIYCVDNAGNGQMSEVWNFTVDVSAPNLTIEAPINITYNSSDVPLNFTVSDNFDLDQCWYILDSDPAQYGCDNSTLESLDDGLHNITVYANDSLNNINSTSSVFFTVDTTSPSLVLVTPINKTYSTLDVPLSFIVSDLIDLDQCWYVLDSNPAVFGCNNRTLESLSQETHLLYLYANDSVNNTNSTNVTFSVELPEEDTPEEEQDESISISFSQQCPENLLEVEVSSGDNTEVNLIMYSPYGGSVDSDTTDGNSVVFSITSSATYQAIASKSGYVSSSAYFEYELCDLVPDDSSNETSDQTDDDEPDETNQTTNQTEDDTTDQTSNQSSNQTTNETSDMQSDAETALEQAQDAIDNAKAAGKDTSAAESFLNQARSAFESGNYSLAEQFAKESIRVTLNSTLETPNIDNVYSNPTSTPKQHDWLWLPILLVLAGLIYLLFGKKKKGSYKPTQ